MDLRQQVTMTKTEIKDVILKHLALKGLRIKDGSLDMKSDGSLFALTMTEEEIFIVDTDVLLKKPISLMELGNAALKKKLIKRLDEDATIGSLLDIKEIKVSTKVDFLSKNSIESTLFYNSGSKKRDKLSDEEEAILIKYFGDLGIKLNKRN